MTLALRHRTQELILPEGKCDVRSSPGHGVALRVDFEVSNPDDGPFVLGIPA